MSVSIIIKAWNEEAHIAAAIESALAALAAVAAPFGIDGDVILADSGSTDRTVEIASRYPIRIARLLNPSDRRCGVGPQLGYQYAEGTFICLIDGDMVLSPDFLRDGLTFLEAHPRAGGVSGALREMQLVSIEFKRRQKRISPELRTGQVDRLNGGGLYRRAAIESAGVFSDRNLHAYEEFDLGLRLGFAGWTLHRLASPFVDHYGHTLGGYRLLWRRYRSRYLFGIGEMLRGAIGRPHFRRTLRDLPEIRLWLGVYAGWIVALSTLPAVPSHPLLALFLVCLGLGPIAALTLRYRSIKLGLYAFVAWNAHAAGMALGFLQRRVSPGLWIESDIIDPKAGATPSSGRGPRAARPASRRDTSALKAKTGLGHV